MVNVSTVGNTLVIAMEDGKYCYPLNSVILIANDTSSIINVRLKASRKNIQQFKYEDVENITASSASEMVDKIAEQANK